MGLYSGVGGYNLVPQVSWVRGSYHRVIYTYYIYIYIYIYIYVHMHIKINTEH